MHAIATDIPALVVTPTLSTQPPRTLYLNREISWLDFNRRVLELAQDQSYPAAGAREISGDFLQQSRRILHEARRWACNGSARPMSAELPWME